MWWWILNLNSWTWVFQPWHGWGGRGVKHEFTPKYGDSNEDNNNVPSVTENLKLCAYWCQEIQSLGFRTWAFPQVTNGIIVIGITPMSMICDESNVRFERKGFSSNFPEETAALIAKSYFGSLCRKRDAEMSPVLLSVFHSIGTSTNETLQYHLTLALIIEPIYGYLRRKRGRLA